MNVRTKFLHMIKMLKTMDEGQLLELFHDLDDIAAVERIADCAYHFVETYQETECESVDPCFHAKSEDEENKEADDLQRYRDIKSTNERPY